jgi:hypothetical protein
MCSAEESTPVQPLKQTSAEPLDCFVQHANIKSDLKSSVRASERAAHRVQRFSTRSVSRQRRALVRHAKLSGRWHSTPAAAKKFVRDCCSRYSVVATVRIRTPSEPNQALEPTSCTVMPRANFLISESSAQSALSSAARGTPAQAVAHL